MAENLTETRKIPAVPSVFPTASTRRRIGGPATTEFSLNIKVVTPIFGGSPRTRDLDRIDFIRVPSIRGQLHF